MRDTGEKKEEDSSREFSEVQWRGTQVSLSEGQWGLGGDGGSFQFVELISQ